MTVYDLTKKDLDKVKISLENAKVKPNVPASELEHLYELCALREEIFEKVNVKGYRKQCEVYFEIVDEIAKCISENKYSTYTAFICDLMYRLQALRKKYVEGDW